MPPHCWQTCDVALDQLDQLSLTNMSPRIELGPHCPTADFPLTSAKTRCSSSARNRSRAVAYPPSQQLLQQRHGTIDQTVERAMRALRRLSMGHEQSQNLTDEESPAGC